MAQKLRSLAHRKRSSFKTVLNEVLRRGMATQERAEAVESPFIVKPHASGFRAGIDLGKLNQLVGQLDAEHLQKKARRKT